MYKWMCEIYVLFKRLEEWWPGVAGLEGNSCGAWIPGGGWSLCNSQRPTGNTAMPTPLMCNSVTCANSLESTAAKTKLCVCVCVWVSQCLNLNVMMKTMKRKKKFYFIQNPKIFTYCYMSQTLKTTVKDDSSMSGHLVLIHWSFL